MVPEQILRGKLKQHETSDAVMMINTIIAKTCWLLPQSLHFAAKTRSCRVLSHISTSHDSHVRYLIYFDIVYSKIFLTKQTLLLVCTFLYLALTTHLNLSNSEGLYIGLDVSYANMPLTSHLFTHGIIEKMDVPFPEQNPYRTRCLEPV